MLGTIGAVAGKVLKKRVAISEIVRITVIVQRHLESPIGPKVSRHNVDVFDMTIYAVHLQSDGCQAF
jgi:hypothetical protein